MVSPTEILTEDQRVLLAGSGGRPIASALGRPEYGIPHLFDSHICRSLSDEALALRPQWKPCLMGFRVERGRIVLNGAEEHGLAPVWIARKRLAQYAESLPESWRTELAKDQEMPRLTLEDVVWQALMLPGRPYRDQILTKSNSSSTTATVGEVSDDQGYEAVETIAAVEKVATLRASVDSSQPLTGGQLFGLPPLEGDVWADIAGAQVLTGIAPKTITSFLSRSGPKALPFPRPRKFLGRLYWPARELIEWSREYGAIRS